MNPFAELFRRLRFLFRRDRAEAELEEEMQFHLEMREREEREAGASPEEAREIARRAFGGNLRLRESGRDAWGWIWLDRLWQDLTYGVRVLRRYPGLTAGAVLTIALAIGANTAVFSLIEAVMLRPLPYREPERLCMLWTVEAKSQQSMNSSYPDFRDWEQQSRAFESMVAFSTPSVSLSGGAEPEQVSGLSATPRLCEVLGIRPALGRCLREGDEHDVVISHRLWLRRFGGDPQIVGRTTRVDGEPRTIAGVLPAGFHFQPRHWVRDPEVVVPMRPFRDRTMWFLRIIARLRPGVTERQAQAEMNAIGARLAETYPPERRRQGIEVTSLVQHTVRSVRATAWMLVGAVGFVLLIACANVANLLLSQAASRQREIGTRLALGASRARVIRQLLTESAMLSAMGGVLGILLAYWALPLLVAMAPERSGFLSRIEDTGIQLNATVLWFTVSIAVLAGLLFGLAPAWSSTTIVRTPRTGRLRGALVLVQVALSVVLLAGTGLMLQSVARLLAVDPGFRPQQLLSMHVTLPDARYADPARKLTFLRAVLQRMRALPEVQSAGAIEDLPLTRSWSMNTIQLTEPVPREGRAFFHSVSADYFAAMRISIVRGRGLSESDSERAPAVVVISRNMAGTFWPGADPIGRGILVTRGVWESTPKGNQVRWVKDRVEIVGIVSDVREGLDVPLCPEVYFTYAQRPSEEMTFVVRSSGEIGTLAAAARRSIWAVDAEQPVAEVKPVRQWVSAETAAHRFVLVLVGAFAILALVLAVTGVYAVSSYAVACRTREIGIRMALGASGGGIAALVLRGQAAWVAAGAAMGTAGGLTAARLLRSYLYEVQPHDTATFVAVPLFLLACALAATLLPARRAMRTDPAQALRRE